MKEWVGPYIYIGPRWQAKQRRKKEVASFNAEFELREQDKARPAWLANLRQPAPHKNGKR